MKKTASAHDLRRAFGERWAARLMPAQLMELMRHETIETTRKTETKKPRSKRGKTSA